MCNNESLEYSAPLACLASASECAWRLVGYGQLDDGSCFIASDHDMEAGRASGFFDGKTGCVYACDVDLDDGSSLEAYRLEGEPAVRAIGSPDGATGQLTVRQPAGNYLRICRWDRLEGDLAARAGALFRTLPQCGCGGSLGTPKMFDSFAEMSAYHFGAFYHA